MIYLKINFIMSFVLSFRIFDQEQTLPHLKSVIMDALLLLLLLQHAAFAHLKAVIHQIQHYNRVVQANVIHIHRD